MGFEPTTSTLARLRSTTELHPQNPDFRKIQTFTIMPDFDDFVNYGIGQLSLIYEMIYEIGCRGKPLHNPFQTDM
jgi:hypothetical protein